LWQKLEALSDYRPLSEDGETAVTHPIALSHLRLTVLGKTWSVLSRACMAGVDHSRRRIFFAHHVALEAGELPAAGPAWLAGQPGFLQTHWDGQVHELPFGRPAPEGTSPPAVCRAWHQAAGDAGWAGVLAEEHEKNPTRPIYLLYPLGLDPLPLLLEALALLPAERRWQVTFSTLCRSLPQDVTCVWRCLPLAAPEARTARTMPGALVFDLGRPLGQAEGGALVDAARTGTAARGSAPALTGTGWQPRRGPTSAPLAPERIERERERFEEVVPVEEPAPLSVVEPAPAPRGGASWLVPFAVGLVLGVLLLGGGAVVGWRVLENAHVRSLAEARQRAEHERKDALEKARTAAALDKTAALEKLMTRAKTEKATAVKQASDDAAREREEAVNQTRGRMETAREEAIRRALKDAVPKADLDRAVKSRNNALDALVSGLFDEDSREARQVKNHLQAVQDGKAPNPADLTASLKEWTALERRKLTENEKLQELLNLHAAVAYCEGQFISIGRKVRGDPGYRKSYAGARSLQKSLSTQINSLLIRKIMDRIEERLKKLPKP
jgi:hypothetical protein